MIFNCDNRPKFYTYNHNIYNYNLKSKFKKEKVFFNKL